MAVLTIPDHAPDHEIEDSFHPNVDLFRQLHSAINPVDVDTSIYMIRGGKKLVAFLGVGIKDARAEVMEFVERYFLPFNQTMPFQGHH
ncbi:hypothetical protein [Bifidobacterium xylocopae]|uniref:Uncharacterized protein n=1 Tax=Bifidobacterium xylocopae TaxID=2493119 RepID=A0A366KC39_9BIFI|nr:hypothetical protein [Bifidobacterium xylocopae]RBP98927.1 hypothetical protein CRD59_06430 [Bifidobacterium xylocopae]